MDFLNVFSPIILAKPKSQSLIYKSRSEWRAGKVRDVHTVQAPAVTALQCRLVIACPDQRREPRLAQSSIN